MTTKLGMFKVLTVVSKYRFYQVGLFLALLNFKSALSFLFNARTKTKPVPESLLAKLLDRSCNKRIYTFFYP